MSSDRRAQSRLHRSRSILRLVLAVLGAVVLLGVTAAVFPGQILTVDSGKVQADAIVVLGGGGFERPVRAAELFHEQAAPRIILTGNDDWVANRKLLVEKGVAPEAISVEPKARSTRENAMYTAPLLRSSGQPPPAGVGSGSVSAGERGHASAQVPEPSPPSAILVTSWYHSRRALTTFRSIAPDIHFYSRPSYFGYPGSADSVNARALRHYAWKEYVKLLGYWVRYGVTPF